MNISHSILIWAVLAVAVLTPLACISFGVSRLICKSSGGKLFLGIGVGIVCVYGILAARYMMMIGVGKSGIVARGVSPEGREYCIIQTFKGWAEPYQVSFYIRDAAGVWRWNYLAHQDNAWNSATVTFSGGVAHVNRDGRFYRDVELPTNTVDLANIQPGYRSEYSPSNFTAEDIFSFHNKKYGDH